MSKVRLLVETLILLVIVCLTIAFIMTNRSDIELDLLFAAYQVDLGIALVVAFVIGSLIGFLFRLPQMFKRSSRPKKPAIPKASSSKNAQKSLNAPS